MPEPTPYDDIEITQSSTHPASAHLSKEQSCTVVRYLSQQAK
jgi:hypothetical protein